MILRIELGNRHFHLGEIADNYCCGLVSILCMDSSYAGGDSSGVADQTLAKTSKRQRSLGLVMALNQDFNFLCQLTLV